MQNIIIPEKPSSKDCGGGETALTRCCIYHLSQEETDTQESNCIVKGQIDLTPCFHKGGVSFYSGHKPEICEGQIPVSWVCLGVFIQWIHSVEPRPARTAPLKKLLEFGSWFCLHLCQSEMLSCSPGVCDLTSPEGDADSVSCSSLLRKRRERKRRRSGRARRQRKGCDEQVS